MTDLQEYLYLRLKDVNMEGYVNRLKAMRYPNCPSRNQLLSLSAWLDAYQYGSTNVSDGVWRYRLPEWFAKREKELKLK